jgi:hypothetical protein
MQITSDQLLAEASQMALELRLKGRAIAELEVECDRLRKRLADLGDADGAPGTS